MILEESVTIAAPPDRVAAFFETLDRRYREWHPDHIAFHWLDAARSRAFFCERIGRWTLRMNLAVTRSADGFVATCGPTSPLLRLAFPWMTFAVAPDPAGSRYVHRIRLRLGPLRPLAERTLLAPLRRHMREETANLPGLIGESGVAKQSQ